MITSLSKYVFIQIKIEFFVTNFCLIHILDAYCLLQNEILYILKQISI